MNPRQFEAIFEAIAATRDGELSCVDLDAQRLAEYVDLELAGVPAEERLPDVAQHLALCPDCRADYRAVLTLLQALEAEALLEPTHQPDFDLSFLTRAAAPAAPWQQIAANVRRYAETLPLLLLRQLHELGRLPAGVTLYPPAPAAQRMRGPSPDEPPIRLALADPSTGFAADLRIRLAGRAGASIGVRPVFPAEHVAAASVALLDELGRPVELRAVADVAPVEFRDVAVDRTWGLRFRAGAAVWEIVLDLRSPESGADVAKG